MVYIFLGKINGLRFAASGTFIITFFQKKGLHRIKLIRTQLYTLNGFQGRQSRNMMEEEQNGIPCESSEAESDPPHLLHFTEGVSLLDEDLAQLDLSSSSNDMNLSAKIKQQPNPF